jgi:hypothetical protein
MIFSLGRSFPLLGLMYMQPSYQLCPKNKQIKTIYYKMMGNWVLGLRRNDQTRHGDFTGSELSFFNGIGQAKMGKGGR